MLARAAIACLLFTVAFPLDAAAHLVVHLNFDGGELRQGSDDAINNTSSLLQSAVLDYPPIDWNRFGGRSVAEAQILNRLALLFIDYGVVFVSERPESGDRTMIMVGGTGQGVVASTVYGAAPLDCGDSNFSDVGFVFSGNLSSARAVADAIAHQYGHALGLEHVVQPGNIMSSELGDDICCFSSADLATQEGVCRAQQNAKGVLSATLPNDGGMLLRTWFLSPNLQATVPSTFTVEVLIEPVARVKVARLFVDGTAVHTWSQGSPFTVQLDQVGDGEHLLRIEAVDLDGVRTFVDQVVNVRGDCQTRGTCVVGLAAIGNACTRAADCATELCATDGVAGTCIDRCEFSQICPTGTACVPIDGVSVCVASASLTILHKSAGGCAIGHGMTWCWLLICLCFLLRRRLRG